MSNGHGGKIPCPFLFLFSVINSYTYNFFHFFDHIGMVDAVVIGSKQQKQQP